MSEIEVKTERVVEFLKRESLDGVILNAQHNFAWATGGGNNGVDLSRENGVASVLFAADGGRYVLANNIEIHRMIEEELPADLFEPIQYTWQDEKASGDLVVERARKLVGKNIASDIALHSSAPAVESKFGQLRHQLTGEEKARYRSLGADSAEAFRKTILSIQPGQTESQIAETMRHELGNAGATAVVALVAADERILKFRHPLPTNNVWRKTLMLVTCAKRDGLIVNLTRMVCVGKIPAELAERTNAAALINARLWSATRAGVSSRELYEVAANSYIETGFAGEIDLHHQGGATGYRTRDWVAHPAGNDVVVRDQAFAWNPSITGTKVEETMFLDGDVPEAITLSRVSLTINHTIDGVEYAVSDIVSV